MNLNGIDVAVLSGVPGMGDPFDDGVYNYLLETRAAALNNPQAYSVEFVTALEFAIQYWNTPQRQEALDALALQEESGALGRLNRDGKFFKNLQKVGRGAKKAMRAVVKYNPVSTLARTGLMLALKLNLRGMRKKLRWGYASRTQAQEAGVDSRTHQRTQNALEKVKLLWVKKLFGKEETLKNIILKGDDQGIGQLGAEPVTTAAAITAATPVIVAVIKILKDAGLISKDEDTSESSIRAEMNRKAQSSSVAPYSQGTEPMAPMDSESGNFFKNNSTLILAGAGVAVVGGYFLLRKKPAKKTLSGGECLNGSCSKANLGRTKKTTRRKSTVKRKPLKSPLRVNQRLRM